MSSFGKQAATDLPISHTHLAFLFDSGVFDQTLVRQGGFQNCMERVESNPRADLEKKILSPGVNVDVLLDYDDLDKGVMHVGKSDCSHYCMPGVPDIVAARLLDLMFAT